MGNKFETSPVTKVFLDVREWQLNESKDGVGAFVCFSSYCLIFQKLGSWIFYILYKIYNIFYLVMVFKIIFQEIKSSVAK